MEPSTLSQIDYEMDQLRKKRESLIKAAIEQKIDEYVEQLTEGCSIFFLRAK
jgi:hypothetical protein